MKLGQSIATVQVKSTKTIGHEKHVRFGASSNLPPLILPRFAQVSKDDLLFIKGINNKTIWLNSIDEPKKKIIILPVYTNTKQLRVGSRRLSLCIREIQTRDEHEAYMGLERFHYRTSPSLIEQEEKIDGGQSGRRAVLLASITIGKKEVYVGYIELSMPLMMVAPRHRAFARPFEHSSRPISWAKWDQSSLRKNLNLIVRIARVVTHPTFRGIGLSHLLVNEAEDYARERWHIGTRRPICMEISAEMLNYFDFVSGCGFTYCGHTDGNKARVAKDMRQMARGQKITSGIMTLQNKYYSGLQNYAEYEGCSLEMAIKKIEKMAESEDPESMVDDEAWLLLRKIFRQPRPYYVKGLDHDTKMYIKGVRVDKDNVQKDYNKKVNPKIIIKNLVVKATIKLPKSRSVKVIKDSFGLEGSEVKQTLLKIDEFRATQGNIYLLAGASGTGKSIFLDVLGHKERGIHENIEISYEHLEVENTAILSEINPEQIVIDYFSNKYGLTDSLKTLAVVGLSEAMPMVKPFWMLSKGQKYRALLADLILSNTGVWLLDEFGAELDSITATILASKVRKMADRMGVIVFVAAANNNHFYQALRPTRVFSFDMGKQPEIKTVTEYKNELF